MSWAACDRLGNVAARIGRRDRVKVWNDRAAKIRATIEREAWSEEQGHYGAAFGHPHLDASLPKMVERRFIRAGDPRFQSTFAANEKAPRRGEHMLRYARVERQRVVEGNSESVRVALGGGRIIK